MGPTPTRTLGMRLSSNLVNVLIVYSTRVHVYTRASLTDNLARKRACRTSPARGKLNGEPREDPRTEVSEDVRVGVSVRVGPMEFQLNAIQLC